MPSKTHLASIYLACELLPTSWKWDDVEELFHIVEKPDKKKKKKEKGSCVP